MLGDSVDRGNLVQFCRFTGGNLTIIDQKHKFSPPLPLGLERPIFANNFTYNDKNDTDWANNLHVSLRVVSIGLCVADSPRTVSPDRLHQRKVQLQSHLDLLLRSSSGAGREREYRILPASANALLSTDEPARYVNLDRSNLTQNAGLTPSSARHRPHCPNHEARSPLDRRKRNTRSRHNISNFLGYVSPRNGGRQNEEGSRSDRRTWRLFEIRLGSDDEEIEEGYARETDRGAYQFHWANLVGAGGEERTTRTDHRLADTPPHAAASYHARLRAADQIGRATILRLNKKRKVPIRLVDWGGHILGQEKHSFDPIHPLPVRIFAR